VLILFIIWLPVNSRYVVDLKVYEELQALTPNRHFREGGNPVTVTQTYWEVTRAYVSRMFKADVVKTCDVFL
jgi:hypothetical protein